MLEQRLGIAARIEIIKTRGDRIQDVAFSKMEGKGFFTKELQDALLDGRVDLVVHSLKDLPTDEPEGLEVVAIPERTNPADLLLAREGLHRSPRRTTPSDSPTARCSEPRPCDAPPRRWRCAPASRSRPCAATSRPGSASSATAGYDAILLAAAGVGRLELDLTGLDVVELRPEVMLPAPGQGALAIETRRERRPHPGPAPASTMPRSRITSLRSAVSSNSSAAVATSPWVVSPNPPPAGSVSRRSSAGSTRR